MQTSENQSRAEVDEMSALHNEAGHKEVDLSRRRLFMPVKRLRKAKTEDHALPEAALTPSPSDASEVATKVLHLKEEMASLVRGNSAQKSLLTSREMFRELFMQEVLLHVVNEAGELVVLEEPFSIEDDQKTGMIRETLQALLVDEAFEDIVELVGQKTCYYYSAKSISSNYAKMLMLIEEKDQCTMIAEMVRFECVTYPRPYAVEMLQYAPFFLSEEQIHTAIAALKAALGCEDIVTMTASNGALYLYSSEHMTPAMAKGLCEWIEVEQFANP